MVSTLPRSELIGKTVARPSDCQPTILPFCWRLLRQEDRKHGSFPSGYDAASHFYKPTMSLNDSPD